MADELRIGLQELLRKAQIEGDAQFLKEGVRVLSQMLMEMEVEQHNRRLSPRAQPRAHSSAQWLPPEELGHESWEC
jgi:hypothetical protein